MSPLKEVETFIRDLKTHQKNPADVKKYERWVKELKDPVRKTLLEVIHLNPVSDQDLSTLNDEIKRIKPIVASKQSFKTLSTRKKGLWKSICRAFSNLFQNRTSSREVMNAVEDRVYNNTAGQQLSSDQKDRLDKNLFSLVADLPCREIADFESVDEIPGLVGQDPLSILYVKNGNVYLGLKLKAIHTPVNGPQQEPLSFDMLIRLNDKFTIWSADKASQNIFDGFQAYTLLPLVGDILPSLNGLKEVFWRNERQDDPEMITEGCYGDPRWLITRLSNGDTASVRHVPTDIFYYDITKPTSENYGYWELSLNT